MLIQIFGEMLYYPQAECLAELPSTESLKHRIVISTKPPKEYLESKDSKDKESILTGERESFQEASGRETPGFMAEQEANERVSWNMMYKFAV